MNDDELMRLTAQGEDAAFRTLVQRWEEGVFAFLYHMVGDADEARDLAQDTFVKVHQQAGGYRPEGRFRSWLFRIAGNKARSVLRRRKVVSWLPFDIERHDRSGGEETPDGRLERQQLQREVRSAVHGLPDRQRQAIIMRRYLDWTYEEIAEALDTSTGAVDSLLQRGMATLRERLRGKAEEL